MKYDELVFADKQYAKTKKMRDVDYDKLRMKKNAKNRDKFRHQKRED